MTTRTFFTTTLTVAAIAFGVGHARRARADKPAAAPAAAAAPTNCKAFGGGKCCDAEVKAHLTKEAVFKACGESDATFLGEVGSKETCKYVFKVEGEKADDTYVQVYSPAQKEVPPQPADPFYSYKKVGKVSMTDKAKSPKVAANLNNYTGLYLPGKGYFVSVNASTKVCTKPEARALAGNIR